ncbi:class I SAM-dependent methyltransferase [Sulfurisoma sediminicola]|uniref:Methyltransferase family protein n=1 Tax=Sulfurisoma sediminicola TaxID=1381557 RepID=A0A497XI92_9PROT|nr:class I SAM-dependent methyltransferase [Sulfurisoma sediminicola]RLJ67593.1 methyltransferase family protein [Sulfurisoma sediminicola]
MDNYEFCVRWIAERKGGRKLTVLDYGCGAGQIVKGLRQQGIDAFGCDVFYDGGSYESAVDRELLGQVIFPMDANTNVIPFPDGTFDLVVSNQVMEHVPDLDRVLAEIHRVMKPGAQVLSLFPDRSVWREGHVGIPFLHWFPKRSAFRVHYAATLAALGLGYFRQGRSPMNWSREMCSWLDQWTHYRTLDDIHGAFARRFVAIGHIEEEWLGKRLEHRKSLVAIVPVAFRRFVVRKLAGLVFTASKP